MPLSTTLPRIEPPLPPLPSCSTPAPIVQFVVAVVEPVKVQVLLPVFRKAPKPWYCALAPICERLKLASLLPPSARVSALLNARTLPVIAEPAPSVSVLTPPVKVMALARVTPSPLSPPEIAPLLMIVTPAPTTPTPPAPATP